MNSLSGSPVRESWQDVLPVLRCPSCEASLQRQGNEVVCENNHHFVVSDQIPVLSNNICYHFPVPSREQIERALCVMDQDGFDAGMTALAREFEQDQALTIRSYMLNEARAAWKVFIPDLDGKRVLDFGCGWGNLSVAFARTAKNVMGMDLSLQRVRFAQRRATHEGLDNLTFVVGGDGDNLPFADGSFDVVLLNGVLEWIPTTLWRDKDPEEAQRAFLAEVNRITAPGGMVCIAIENRIGLYYLLGATDEHTGLRWITLLPRFLANWYSKRRRKGTCYREYTHTIWKLRRMAVDAGFHETRTVVPFMNYRFYDYLYSYRAPLKFWDVFSATRKLHKLHAIVHALFPWLANAFIFLGTKKALMAATVPDLAQLLRSISEVRLQPDSSVRVLATDCLLVPLPRKRGGEVIVKVPLSPASLQANIAGHRNLERMVEDPCTPKWLLGLLPRPLGVVSQKGYTAFVQTFLSGKSGAALVADPKHSEEIINSGIRLVTQLHRDTARLTRLTSLDFEAVVDPVIAYGLGLLPNQLARDVRKALRDCIIGRSIPLVLQHGDYWIKNILFNPRTAAVIGILDWDRVSMKGLPLLDLLHFCVLSSPGLGGQSLSQRLKDVIQNVLSRKGGARQFMDVAELDAELVWVIATMYFLQRLPIHQLWITEHDAAFLKEAMEKYRAK